MDRKDSLQGVFAQAAVGIASCSLDGTILLANERLGEILGSSTGDLLQRTLPSVLHPDETARASDLFARVAEPNFASCTFETRSVKSAWISATISPVRNSGGVIEGIAVVVHDIDDRKDTEAAYRRTAEQIERLYRISNAVIRAEDVSHIFELALEGLQEALGADRAAVLLYENDGVMRFKAWSGLTDDYRAMAEGHSPWAKDARDPQPVLVADVALDPGLEALRDRILEYGIRSLAFVPLVYNDQLLGKLMIYYNASHSFTPDEVQVAQTVANHVAFAISRKLAEERLLLYQQIVQKSIDGIAILDG
ncbi:MAG: GAF domain-containing protein [Fimbriimonas sp.]